MQLPHAHLRASSSFFAAGGWPSNTYTGLTPASSMRAVLKNMPCRWLRSTKQCHTPLFINNTNAKQARDF
jgi:hypothetical protein